MKNIIIGFFSVCFLILAALGISMVSGKSIRQNELDSMVSDAIDDTMNVLTQADTYEITDEKQLVADTIQNILVRADSDSIYTVTVYEADKEKGIIDVEVTEKYKQPFKAGKVSVRKVAVTESYQNANQDKNIYYAVTFRTKNEILKQYSVNINSTLPASMIPSGYSKWEYNGKQYTNEEITKMKVKQNMTLTGIK